MHKPVMIIFSIIGRSLSCHDNIPKQVFSCTVLYTIGLDIDSSSRSVTVICKWHTVYII